jgi:hypothetical protein|tara:strand:- start:103 stop:573 length:471 start_codon:yes stop_codon:yes gene_type:complete
MANIVPFSFPVELLSGTHNFSSGGNQYTMSLYVGSGSFPYTTASTIYSATDEVSAGGGSQYSAFAWTNTQQAVSNVSNYATVDFTVNPNWGSGGGGPATFSARYAAIYNVTNGNKLVVVLDFGASFSCSNGTFTVTIPSPTAGSPSGADAILSINS